MAIVSDTSPIIAFSNIKKIEIFNKVYGNIYIPEAVRAEILKGGNKPGVKEVQQYKWFKTAKIKNTNEAKKLNQFIGLGESEAIVLADEMNLLLLCDDGKARKIASIMGYKNIIGTCAFLVKAKRLGLVNNIRLIIEELVQSGYRLGEGIINATLQEAGEV